MSSHADTLSLPAHTAGTPHVATALLVKVVDLTVIAGLLALFVWGRQIPLTTDYVVLAALAAGLFVLLGDARHLYRPWLAEAPGRQWLVIGGVWLQVVLILLALAYALKTTASFSRTATGLWLLAVPLALCGWRLLYRPLYARLAVPLATRRPTLVWGSGAAARHLTHALARQPWLGLELHTARAYTARDADRHAAQLQQIERLARRGEVAIVYIALPPAAWRLAQRLIDQLADTTVSVFLVPPLVTGPLTGGRWSSLHGVPLVSVYDTPFWGVAGWLKRLEDVLGAALILPLIALPLALIAVAVKRSSPGPVLFKQRRYGINGCEIQVWKFRTMTVCEDGPVVTQAQRQDPRVTRVGALLRRTSLDELPQFLNVLRGEMSIVGPRPHAIAHNELYRGKIHGYMLRHLVRPGITGWAQVNGWRGETDTEDKMVKRVEHDLWYIRHWSLWLDLKIILRTVLRGFGGHAAY